MAARGTTFAKQDRERAKKAKAALKQERRAAREAEQAEQAEATPEIPEEGEIPPDALLRLVQELHDSFAEGRMSFEDFEQAKTELMARISVT